MGQMIQATSVDKNIGVMAIQVLSAIGVSHLNILRALPKLVGKQHDEVARSLGISRQAVTKVLNLQRCSKEMQSRIAGEFNIPVEIMFPENTAE
jgi:hypothetical protein